MTNWLKRISPFAVMALLSVAIYVGWMIRNGSYAVGGCDSSGYANLARGIATWDFVHTPEPLTRLNLPPEYLNSFRPLCYVPGKKPGTLAPIYSIGFPLHLAFGAWLLGWKIGPFIVNPIFAGLGLLLMYGLGLQFGLSRYWSLLGTVLLACTPTYIGMALQPMSDLVTSVWMMLALWAAIRTNQTESKPFLWAAVAGAAFGVLILIRPMNLILVLPILIGLRPHWRIWLCFMLGGVPLALLLFSYNLAAYGAALATGYAGEGLLDAIKLSYLPPRLASYAGWLMLSLSPLPLLGWLVNAFNPKVALRWRVLLAAWFGALLLFYCCYRVYEGWFYLRFLLPAIPALFLGLMLLGQSIESWWQQRSCLRRGAVWVPILMGLLIVSFEIAFILQKPILAIRAEQHILRQSTLWANKTMPPGVIVVSKEMSGALRFYTNHPILRWDFTDSPQWSNIAQRLVDTNWRCYALLMSHEIKEAQERLPGNWISLGAYQYISLWEVELAPATKLADRR